MQRLNRAVSLKEIAGDRPFGTPSECPDCGAESDLLTNPGGHKYYQLRCECHRRKVKAHAQKTFDAACATWARAKADIDHLSLESPKTRDEGLWNQAWGAAKRAAREAQEYAATFGFHLPERLNAWGREIFKVGWEVRR